MKYGKPRVILAKRGLSIKSQQEKQNIKQFLDE